MDPAETSSGSSEDTVVDMGYKTESMAGLLPVHMREAEAPRAGPSWTRHLPHLPRRRMCILAGVCFMLLAAYRVLLYDASARSVQGVDKGPLDTAKNRDAMETALEELGDAVNVDFSEEGDTYGSWAPKDPPNRSALKSLGQEAYDVYNVDDVTLDEYEARLVKFVQEYFPKGDGDLNDPSSFVNEMRRHLRMDKGREDREPLDGTGRIPRKMFRTVKWVGQEPDVLVDPRSCEKAMPGLEVVELDDARMDEWVRRHFARPLLSRRKSILDTWNALRSPRILQSDFIRYLVLMKEGGIYNDLDVGCLKPLEMWGRDPAWEAQGGEGEARVPLDYSPPDIIVGVEADVGDRGDWHAWWPRPLQIAQWTMAAAPAHPVFVDTVRRIVMAAEERAAEAREGAQTEAEIHAHKDGAGREPESVMERTGPGPFTDAVLTYVHARWHVSWTDLQGLPARGWRFHGRAFGDWGDLKVLSITGFSPGVNQMGSHSTEDPAAMVHHFFSGSWHEK